MVRILAQIAALLSASLVLAQEPAEPWQFLRDLDVRGAVTFTPEQLRNGLLADPAILDFMSGRVGSIEMPQLAAAVLRLYQHNGFAAAKVTAVMAEGHAIATIEEGVRSFCGAIRCEGNHEIAAETICAPLHGSSDVWHGWPAHGAAPLDEATLQVATELVRKVYADAGRLGVRFQLRREPQEDLVDLVVEVADEGHLVRVASIELLGERADDRDAVLSRLHWQPGDLLTAAWQDGLRSQLEALGRYTDVVFKLPEQPAEVLDPLSIRVRLLPHAQALDAWQQSDVSAVRSWLGNVEAELQSGKVVRLERTIEKALTWHGLHIEPGTVRIDFASQGVAVVIPALRWGARPAERFELLVTSGRLWLTLGDLHIDQPFSHPLGISASVHFLFNREGMAELNWGIRFGAAAKAETLLSTTVHPAIASYLLYGPDPRVKRDGENLTLLVADGRVRIGPDGAVLDRRVDFAGEPSQRLTLTEVRIADVLQDFRDHHPGTGMGLSEGLRSWCVAQGSAWEEALPAEAKTAAALVRGVVIAMRKPPSEPLESPQPVAESVSTPTTARSEQILGARLLMLGTRPEMLGWPADLCGAFGTLLLGRGPVAGRSFAAFEANETYGPIAMSVAAQGLEFLGVAGPSDHFLRVASERWGFEAAYRDLDSVASKIPAVGNVMHDLGAQWRNLPELASLFAALPTDGDGDREAFRLGLQELWRAGLGEWLHSRWFAK
jgi:hypothetical protein